jgi:hypothetical protein
MKLTLYSAHMTMFNSYKQHQRIVCISANMDTHLSQTIRERFLGRCLVDLCDTEECLRPIQGVDLDTNNDRHPAEEENHEDGPGEVVGSSSETMSVRGVCRDEHGESGEEQSDGHEREDTDTEHSGIKACCSSSHQLM